MQGRLERIARPLPVVLMVIMGAIAGWSAPQVLPWLAIAGAAIAILLRRATVQRRRWTARLQASEQRAARLEMVQEATHDIVVAMDAGGRLRSMNGRAHEELTPLLYGEVRPGQPIEPALLRLFGDAAKRLERGFDLLGSGQIEEEFETKLGRRVYRVALLPDPSGGRIVCMSDVTAQHRRWEEEHQRQQQEARMENLESLHRLQRDFINTASHELQTPLTPLRLQARILRTRAAARLSDEDIRSLEVIERNTDRMARLVDDILEVVRMGNGRLPVSMQAMDLASVAQATIEDHVAFAKEGHVSLAYKGPAALPLEGDPIRLEQVLGNLLNNAVKFSDAGQAIEIGLSEQDGDAVLTVCDQGAGMDPEELEGLFQPFSQFHHDVLPGRGTGLGLAICQGIMEALGGDISAYSAGRGHGTTFTVRMPLHRPGHERVELAVAPRVL